LKLEEQRKRCIYCFLFSFIINKWHVILLLLILNFITDYSKISPSFVLLDYSIQFNVAMAISAIPIRCMFAIFTANSQNSERRDECELVHILCLHIYHYHHHSEKTTVVIVTTFCIART